MRLHNLLPVTPLTPLTWVWLWVGLTSLEGFWGAPRGLGVAWGLRCPADVRAVEGDFALERGVGIGLGDKLFRRMCSWLVVVVVVVVVVQWL